MENQDEVRKTMSIPEAGERYLGLNRYASYRAARGGFIPTIQIGAKRRRVSVASMEKLIAAKDPAV